MKIFVCYRREDTAGFARALKMALSERFGSDRIFMDLDNIEPGELWKDVVNKAVSNCDALIALVGTQWLKARDPGGQRRLDNPVDPVRLEIETAMREGLRVIPILLQGAKMPPIDRLPEDLAGLPGIQALAITDDWDSGVARLMAALDRLGKDASADITTELELAAPPAEPVAVADLPLRPSPSDLQPPMQGPISRALVAVIVVLGLVGIGVGYVSLNRGDSSTEGTSKALHDYLWNAYNLVQRSAEQRADVGDAIQANDAAALRELQEGRRQLLETVGQWDVPDEAREANLALEQALQYSAISDGNWASYVEGAMTSDEAVAYDRERTHPAKYKFDRLYNRLRAGVQDGPPRLRTDFLF